jgi:hypothetical protein
MIAQAAAKPRRGEMLIKHGLMDKNDAKIV